MSQENVEIVRSMTEEFTRTLRAPDVVSPAFVWDLTTFEGWPDKAVHRGRDEFHAFIEVWLEAYERWTQEIERVIDVGEDQVLVLLRQCALPKGGVANVVLDFAVLYTVRDGSVTYAKVYASHADALEAAGLSE
jgi:ketosteroid isomerase-like protein